MTWLLVIITVCLGLLGTAASLALPLILIYTHHTIHSHTIQLNSKSTSPLSLLFPSSMASLIESGWQVLPFTLCIYFNLSSLPTASTATFFHSLANFLASFPGTDLPCDFRRCLLSIYRFIDVVGQSLRIIGFV